MGRKPSGIRPFSLYHSSPCSQKKGKHLREPRKCHEKLFGVCGSPASASKNFLAFAGAPQVPRKTFWRLRESRKCLEKLFGVCGNSASASENFLVFAGAPQTPLSTFSCLRKFRKRHFPLFHACGSSANAIFSFWTLAEVPQTPRKDEAPGTRRVREPHHTACTRRILPRGPSALSASFDRSQSAPRAS